MSKTACRFDDCCFIRLICIGFLATRVFVSSAQVPVSFDFSSATDTSYWSNALGTAWAYSSERAALVLETQASNPIFPPGDSASSLWITEPGLLGNFRMNGINRIGFDFQSDSVKPTTLQLLLHNTNNDGVVDTYLQQRVVVGGSTSISVSMTSRAAGPWGLGTMPDAEFQNFIEDITAIELYIEPNGTNLQEYVLHSFWIESVPEPVAAMPQADGSLQLTWSPLLDSRSYAVQATTNLLDPTAWVTIEPDLSTNGMVVDTADTWLPFRVYRVDWEP
jgi:hypothetical protein